MTWVVDNLDLILQRSVQHLALAVPAILLSFVLAVPLGWVANRYRWSRATLLTVLGLLYALPSLPLLIVLPLILGTGARSEINVVVALTLYGVALMVRTSADGLASVSPDVLQASSAVGFSAAKRFWTVELPLAGPVLLSGIRVVAVSTVSLVTVSAVLGIQSLGSFFTDGFQRGITAEVMTGIVMTVVLALAVDGALVLAGRLLLPWARADSRRSNRPAIRMAAVSG